MNKKLPFGLESIADQVSKLTLRGGLAGKICHVIIYVALAMAAISWSVKVVWVAVAALGFIFLLTFVVLWRLINLADKNPQSALMEGAELLIHEQMTIGTKSKPEMKIIVQDNVETAPLQVSAEEQRQLNEPEDIEGNGSR
ncbi:MAG: hypothetical protein JWR26_1624 [Pedosphaera sp.]|nr:hypothetical protein [Pedosphaera sp.]